MRVLFILLLLASIPVWAHAQRDTLRSFWGLDFGLTKDGIKAALDRRGIVYEPRVFEEIRRYPGFDCDTPILKHTFVFINGLKFEGVETYGLSLTMAGELLQAGGATFLDNDYGPGKPTPGYDHFLRLLKARYGPPQEAPEGNYIHRFAVWFYRGVRIELSQQMQNISVAFADQTMCPRPE